MLPHGGFTLLTMCDVREKGVKDTGTTVTSYTSHLLQDEAWPGSVCNSKTSFCHTDIVSRVFVTVRICQRSCCTSVVVIHRLLAYTYVMLTSYQHYMAIRGGGLQHNCHNIVILYTTLIRESESYRYAAQSGHFSKTCKIRSNYHEFEHGFVPG